IGWIDYIYYSTITYTTVGYGDFIPKPYPIFRMLAAAEAFLGIFLAGLFIWLKLTEESDEETLELEQEGV
ncbi:MAG: potassium channel family protein, partial [Acidobacteria bacterium]|nr:potassium channel family protein [Acidobacteriota bacterium]